MSISIALKQAHKSAFKYKIGAVITKGGRILGTGYNTVKTYSKDNPHPYKDSIHAEVKAAFNAIRRGPASRLHGGTAYVARVSSCGAGRMARPCISCLRFLKNLGITKLVYTTNEGVTHERI
jgi:deoxycytidylate deaminase